MSVSVGYISAEAKIIINPTKTYFGEGDGSPLVNPETTVYFDSEHRAEVAHFATVHSEITTGETFSVDPLTVETTSVTSHAYVDSGKIERPSNPKNEHSIDDVLFMIRELEDFAAEFLKKHDLPPYNDYINNLILSYIRCINTSYANNSEYGGFFNKWYIICGALNYNFLDYVYANEPQLETSCANFFSRFCRMKIC